MITFEGNFFTELKKAEKKHKRGWSVQVTFSKMRFCGCKKKKGTTIVCLAKVNSTNLSLRQPNCFAFFKFNFQKFLVLWSMCDLVFFSFEKYFCSTFAFWWEEFSFGQHCLNLTNWQQILVGMWTFFSADKLLLIECSQRGCNLCRFPMKEKKGTNWLCCLYGSPFFLALCQNLEAKLRKAALPQTNLPNLFWADKETLFLEKELFLAWRNTNWLLDFFCLALKIATKVFSQKLLAFFLRCLFYMEIVSKLLVPVY